MSKSDTDRAVSQSIIDRLIDFAPKTRNDAQRSRGESVRQLKAALQRDLEWLLNTRRIPIELPEDSEVLRSSLFYYGMPDFSEFARDQLRLIRHLESVISIFEPRLASVRVNMRPTSGSSVHFLIEGILLLDPAPERVAFDTVLELTSGEYEVKGDGSAG